MRIESPTTEREAQILAAEARRDVLLTQVEDLGALLAKANDRIRQIEEHRKFLTKENENTKDMLCAISLAVGNKNEWAHTLELVDTMKRELVTVREELRSTREGNSL